MYIPNDFRPDLDAQNVIRWVEETQHDESKATEEVEDDENVSDKWGIIDMGTAESDLAEAISEADPHNLNEKGWGADILFKTDNVHMEEYLGVAQTTVSEEALRTINT